MDRGRIGSARFGALSDIFLSGRVFYFLRGDIGVSFRAACRAEARRAKAGGIEERDGGKVVDSGGSLSFDKYGTNQIVQLVGVDDKEDRFAGLAVVDSPTGADTRRRA